MRILLDTNRYVDLANGNEESLHRVERASNVFLPFIVLAELRAGFQGGSRIRQNEQKLSRFLNEPNVNVVCADEDTTHHYAAIFQQLRRQGTAMPTNDLWIAALVIQHDLVLFTRDRHFDHLPQIARI